jgi:putative ABC transport system permease protein
MLSNYFKLAIRSLVKYKGVAAINLVSLALGLVSGALILVYVFDEVSFDKFHSNRHRIYRVGTDMVDINTGNLNGRTDTNGWPVGKLLERDFPEVETCVYLANGSSLQVTPTSSGRERFDERIYFAGPEFFKVFDFPLIQGSSAALSQPGSVVLTESTARKYFSGEDALGKSLTLADTMVFEVTGIMKDIPSQSHMQFSMLLSFESYNRLNPGFNYDEGWGNINVRNYVLLKEGVDHAGVVAKARNLYMTYVEEDMKRWGMLMYVDLEPLDRLYLHTKRGNGMGPIGSIDRVYMVSGIAFFVILLACINFINLTTARSTNRAKEVGLRKVVGSTRTSLVRQFLGESFLVTLLALAFALGLIALVMPMFNQWMGKDYNMTALLNPFVLVGVLGLVVGITFLSGYYPAIVLSSLQPGEVLKGNFRTGRRGIQLRRTLVVFQFMISTGLITVTLVVIRQLDYMVNRDLGFSSHQVVVIDADRVTDRGGAGNSTPGSSFKNELQSVASVESVTFTNAVPGRPGWVGQWAFPADRPDEGSIGTEYMAIDEDYLKTLGLSMVAGENFRLDKPFELEEGLIINETAAIAFGWSSAEDAIGKKVDSPSKHPAGTVIGVVKDYHEFGLQRKIYPMAMDYNPQRSRYYAVRFKTTGTSELLTTLESLWKKHHEGHAFKYFFLDENFARQYQTEKQLSGIFVAFSILTIVIAMIGLVGLVSFMVVTRTKEIGIRKVMGAGAMSITRLLSKEFITLVIVANVVACPLAWYFASKWLENFAYRMDLGLDIFALALVFGLTITIVTVSIQTLKAALADPVRSLRYE